MKLGIDAGNYKTKVCGEFGLMDFLSNIGEARQINLQQIHGNDDIVFEYQGEVGFAGSLALYESEFSGSIMGDSKAHKDSLLRILIGIHRYTTLHQIEETIFDIVVGQPIAKHTIDEKSRIKEMVKGWHTIIVNGVEKSFNIHNCEVAAEGVSSYWSNVQNGLVRILDVGSGTVNYSTVIDGRVLDRESGTLSFGVNTNKSDNLLALSRGIATHVLKKWDSQDNVFIVGGIAETTLPHVKEYFPNVNILYPIYNQQYINPIFANAVAFYIIGVNIYG